MARRKWIFVFLRFPISMVENKRNAYNRVPPTQSKSVKLLYLQTISMTVTALNVIKARKCAQHMRHPRAELFRLDGCHTALHAA